MGDRENVITSEGDEEPQELERTVSTAQSNIIHPPHRAERFLFPVHSDLVVACHERHTWVPLGHQYPENQHGVLAGCQLWLEQAHSPSRKM